MKKELEEEIFRKYPDLTRERLLPPSQSCLYFGIETGDGWFNLIERLCSSIENHMKQNSSCAPVTITQIKEKFGGLRFYYYGGDEYVAGLVAMAECLSYKTCEVCGSPGKTNSNGWISVTCEAHKRPND